MEAKSLSMCCALTDSCLLSIGNHRHGHRANLKLGMQLYISIQLLDIWRVEKVDESLWYAWLLQHLNVRLGRSTDSRYCIYGSARKQQQNLIHRTVSLQEKEPSRRKSSKKAKKSDEEVGNQPGLEDLWRSVSTNKDHLNHSIISIISPACCEMTVLSMALIVLQEKSAEPGWDSFSVVVSDDLQMYIKTCCSCHLWCLICQSHHLALPDEEVPEETAEAVATCSVMWSTGLETVPEDRSKMFWRRSTFSSC